MLKSERMEKVFFTGVRNSGATVFGAYVWVKENYTMYQLIQAIKEAGYYLYMTDDMRYFAEVF